MNDLKYKIVVSEPWDFEGPAGPNVVEGVVVKKVSSTCLIFESEHQLKVGNDSGKLLLLKPRYFDQSLMELKGTVAVGLIVTNQYVGKSEVDLEAVTKYAIIGSIMKM